VAAQVTMVRRTHEAFMKPLQFCTSSEVGRQVCAFSTWQWAWAVTWSRALAVPLPSSEGGSVNALIPLLDMANHKAGAGQAQAQAQLGSGQQQQQLRWDVSQVRMDEPCHSVTTVLTQITADATTAAVQGTTLRVVAQAQLGPGDEVLIDYMPDGAPMDFLRQYGFVPLASGDDAEERGGGAAPRERERESAGVEVCPEPEVRVNEWGRMLLVEGAALAERRGEYWRLLAARLLLDVDAVAAE
jgi:hypothetical protein